jgi:hypothetical protein
MNERVVKKKICGGLVLALLLGLSFAPAESRQAVEEGMRNIRAKIAQTVGLGDKALMNVNNISLWFKSDGYSGGNPSTDNSGITFPPLTGQVIYRDGVIWGGHVLDGGSQEIRVGGQNYTAGTVPGAILSPGVAEDPFDSSVRIYRVRPDYQTADLRREAAEFSDVGINAVTQADETVLREQYARDWQEWPWQKGAPFQDRDGDGAYDPSVDIPGFPHADQVAWFVVNDLDAGATGVLYGSDPIGLELQITLWAYENINGFPELDDVIFKQYRLIYKGTDTTPGDARIEEMYFAQWADPDVGDYGDDLVGTDVELDLGYAYNSTSSDSHYDAFALAPPAVGYAFLDHSFSSFSYWAAGGINGDPTLGEYVGTLQWYNTLRGFQTTADIDNPTPHVDPDGNSTLFPLSGKPTLQEYQLQTEPLGNALEACGENAVCRSKLTPSVTILEPGQTTGSEYTISFFEDAGGQIKWRLLRAGEIVLDNLEMSQGPLELPEDGIQINLPSGHGMLDWDIPSGERWWTWAGSSAWGAEGFGGAITGDPGNQWFEATTVEQTRTVEVRFTSVVEAEGEDQYKPLDTDNENVSYAYRYLRNANGEIPSPGDLTTTAVPYDFTPYVVNTEGDGYPFQDRVPICLSAWDIDSDPPRRLEVGFLENLQPGGLVNGAYGPAWYSTIDNLASDGPREWLFIFDLDYTDPAQGQDSDILLNSGLYTEPLPHMWIVFADRRQETRFPQDGDSFLMIPLPPQPYGDGDAFSVEVPFTTPIEGWVDGDEIPGGDRRMAINTGPFDLSLGESREMAVLLAGGLGADNLQSLDRLKDGVRVARDYYTRSNGGLLDIVQPPASNAGVQNLSIADAEGVPGGTLETEITFSGAAGIAGGELLLTYDPALLTPVEVTTTEQTAGFVLDFAINTPGRLGIVLAGNAGLSAESGSLVNVVWEIDAQALSGTSSTLELETFALYDESTLPFSVEAAGGVFTVLNQIPLAEDDLFVVSEDETTVFDVLTNDEDLDGDDLIIVEVTAPTHGTATIDPGDTTVTYTPEPNYHRKDDFSYTIGDGRGATATARAFITIKPVNDLPGTFDRLTPEEGGVLAREAVSFSWEAASDIDGDAITYILDIQAGGEAIERTTQDTSLQIDFLALNLPVTLLAVTWSVSASDGTASTPAGNGEGSFELEGLEPEIVLSATALSFGQVSIGETATQSLNVENLGGSDLVVESIPSANSPFIPSPESFTVPPGGAREVEVICTPLLPGDSPGALTITSNDPAQPTMTVTLSLQAAGLSIWPGDTNDDGRVDGWDILPIGLFWTLEGPPRPETSYDWAVRGVAEWTVGRAPFADADGSGRVDAQDIRPIAQNWRQTRSAGKELADGITNPAIVDPLGLELLQAMVAVLEETPPSPGVTEVRTMLERTIASKLLPREFALYQNAPNPFNPSTSIRFAVPAAVGLAPARLQIFDLTGQQVRLLLEGTAEAGHHSVSWDGRNDAGHPVASGVYFYALQIGDFRAVCRMLLLR